MKQLSQAEIAERAMNCRRIRMFIADNPGTSTRQISAGTGLRKTDTCLFKMVSMGIIRCDLDTNDQGHRVTKWYVIPQ